jgi:DNA polymerase
LGRAGTVVPGDRHLVRAHPRVFFLGEAPGRDEHRYGKPFIGRAGKLLRHCIEEAGIVSYYISNVCFCRPPHNRTPTADEMSTCGKFTLLEIEAIQPHLIVTLGKVATDFLSCFGGNEGYSQLRDLVYWDIEDPITGEEYTVKSVYHPAYILRNRQALPMYQKAFHDIAELSKSFIEEPE